MISEAENNARIIEIERQRDEALMRCAILAGQVAVWKSEATQLNQEMLKYTNLKSKKTKKNRV